jgi:hypothetical protein
MLPLVEVDTLVPIIVEESPKPWIRGYIMAIIALLLSLGRNFLAKSVLKQLRRFLMPFSISSCIFKGRSVSSSEIESRGVGRLTSMVFF